MSIYPVYLASWYPEISTKRPYLPGDYDLHRQAKSMVENFKCEKCGKRCTWKKAWGHHSIPWGHGDIWCSKKCLKERFK